MAMVIRTTMIVRTTISSTKVNPRVRRKPGFTLPLRIRSAIRPFSRGLTINVENVLAAPTHGLGIVLVAAQPPFVPSGERVAREAAQEFHLGSFGVVSLDALYQHFQGFRVPIGTLLDLAKIAHHVEVVVLIDGVAHLAEGGAQLTLALGAHLGARQRNGHAGQDE